MAERLVNRSKSLYDPIKMNNLAVFTSATTKATTKASQQLTSAKNDCSLFSRLKISFFLSLYSFYHTNKKKKRKKMLTGKMCGMARTTELGSKLSVAVKKKIQIQIY